MLPENSGLFLFSLSSSCVSYVASFSGLFLFSLSSSECTKCCQRNWIVFVFFVFVLCTLCCQFLWIVFVFFVFVLCILCCQFLWIVFVFFVFVLCNVASFLATSSQCTKTMLPVSLLFLFSWQHSFLCLRPVYPMLPGFSGLTKFSLSSSCVSYVARFSGLFLFSLSSSTCVHYVARKQKLDCFCFLCLRQSVPMLPVSLDCFCFLCLRQHSVPGRCQKTLDCFCFLCLRLVYLCCQKKSGLKLFSLSSSCTNVARETGFVFVLCT